MVCSFLILLISDTSYKAMPLSLVGEGLFALGAIFIRILVDRIFRKNRLFGIILFLLLGATIYSVLFFSQSAIVLLVMSLFRDDECQTRILRTTTLFQLVPNKLLAGPIAFLVLNTATRILFIVFISLALFSDNLTDPWAFLW